MAGAAHAPALAPRYPAPALESKGKLSSLSTPARRFTRAMSMVEPGFVIRRRKPRGRPILPAGGEGEGVKKAQNNYLAETQKNRAGARPGNRNAVTHGGHTAQNRAGRAAIRAVVRDLRLRAEILLTMADAQARAISTATAETLPGGYGPPSLGTNNSRGTP